MEKFDGGGGVDREGGVRAGTSANLCLWCRLGSCKPRGLHAARKLKNDRRENRWVRFRLEGYAGVMRARWARGWMARAVRVKMLGRDGPG